MSGYRNAIGLSPLTIAAVNVNVIQCVNRIHVCAVANLLCAYYRLDIYTHVSTLLP